MKPNATLGVGIMQISLHHKSLQYPHSIEVVPNYNIPLIGTGSIIICQYSHLACQEILNCQNENVQALRTINKLPQTHPSWHIFTNFCECELKVMAYYDAKPYDHWNYNPTFHTFKNCVYFVCGHSTKNALKYIHAISLNIKNFQCRANLCATIHSCLLSSI